MEALGQSQRTITAHDDETSEAERMEVANDLGGTILLYDDAAATDRILERVETIRGPEDLSTLGKESAYVGATKMAHLLADEPIEAVLDPVDLPVTL
jgi:hypothetical protein